MQDMTHSHVGHDSFTFVTKTHIYDKCEFLSQMSVARVSRLKRLMLKETDAQETDAQEAQETDASCPVWVGSHVLHTATHCNALQHTV